jgi:hypothetical protein
MIEQINEKNIKIIICSNSDIISTFVILKFFIQKTDKILRFFSIIEEEGGLITHKRENIYEFVDYTLNDFLFYFNNIKSGFEYSSGFENSENNKIITGWEIRFKTNIKIEKNDIILIKKKTEDMRECKIKNLSNND